MQGKCSSEGIKRSVRKNIRLISLPKIILKRNNFREHILSFSDLFSYTFLYNFPLFSWILFMISQWSLFMMRDQHSSVWNNLNVLFFKIYKKKPLVFIFFWTTQNVPDSQTLRKFHHKTLSAPEVPIILGGTDSVRQFAVFHRCNSCFEN